jgi:putative ABC transport system permease protein
VRIASVSNDFFPALQMRPHAGRLLTSEDAGRTPASVVVSFSLSEELGGAVAALGQTMVIRNEEHSIIGVAPPRFRGLQAGRDCDAWILMTSTTAPRGDRRLSIVARLASNIDVQSAEEELRRLSDDLAAAHPETNRGNIADADAPRRMMPVLYSRLDPAAGAQTFLIGVIVQGAALLLLATACLNVGTLLLSWAVARRRDLAIKMALGATRGRLVRQLITETLCLSLAGGGLGLLFALWTARAIPALFMTEEAELLSTGLDVRVVLLTIGVACLAGAIFGSAPALHGTAAPAVTALRADSGGVSENQGGTTLRLMLVGTQIALSTVLLLGTGLLVASLTHALEGDMAAVLNKVAFVSLELPGRFVDPVRGVAARNALLEQLPSLDGIEAVGWASTLPLGRGNRLPFRIEGKNANVTDTVEIDTNVVSPGYFRALTLQCIEGRLFDERDSTLAPPVVVVDELLARRYFGASAAGRHLVDQRGTTVEIVGVVRSGRYRTLQQSPQPTVYYPSTQDYLWRGHLIIKTLRDPEGLLESIKSRVTSAGKGADILRDGSGTLQISTLSRHLSEVLSLDRMTTTLVGLCGLIALGMSSIGVYGVIADAVQRRTREIGLRIALGAGRTQVARLVLLEAVYLAAVGLLVGIGLAVALAYVARYFVHGMPTLHVSALAAAAGALALVIIVASLVPLRRALRVNPNIALRAE